MKKLLLLTLVIFLFFLPACGTTTNQSKHLDVGSEAIVQSGDFDDIYLAIDKDAFDKWVNAVNANDKMGVSDLLYSGELFSVPSGTKVLILDISWGAHKVRILEGDKYGKTGWLPSEYLK